MLSESGIRQLFERRYVPANCHYPCKPWLLKPYLQPRQGPQLNYNRAHKTTRAVVDRGIGQLKNLWRMVMKKIFHRGTYPRVDCLTGQTSQNYISGMLTEQVLRMVFDPPGCLE
ncbi:uncharacterized protein LOC120470613 isoform X3 [Pimephales promelas]|uniref:uncharacterized protein LOC120470613 isoform X3 n=1 Tax=Pimephales promelas TaxID=90988 RepID=UPI0019557C30|nr:uncharacterized protein LOC120470613 isoform X3 [Pimephales promelas]